MQGAKVTFDWHFTIGEVVTWCIFVLGGLAAYAKLPNEINRLKEWKVAHTEWSVAKGRQIQEIHDLVLRLDEMVRGQNKRIEMLENRYDRRISSRGHDAD